MTNELDNPIATWVWPSSEAINDFPDPLGFDREWKEWPADMADGPSVEAEIFSREYIQNSWDSIQEQTAKLKRLGRAVDDHGIEFRFVRLTGPDAKQFLSAFEFQGHKDRYQGMSDQHRGDNRLEFSDLVTGDSDVIELLVATERCGQGMFGPWFTGGKAGVVSRLKSALMHTRSEKNNQSAGGSWGHGKKAIANASKCRTIAVYTHFDASEEYPDDQVDTRLLGVSYWRSHDLGQLAHVGIGLLGKFDESQPFGQGFEPLEDDEAHRFIEELSIPGLESRRGTDPASYGTSYLIVEPSFGPADLARAIERNWWPLLGRQSTTITVRDFDGAEIALAPEEREELRPYLAARELATRAAEPRARGEDIIDITVKGHATGTLALTSDDSEDGWSYADPDTNRSVVALVRNDMVIAYEPFPRKRRTKGPFIRGVLLVDREANHTAGELLRMAEPHLHNEWQTEAGNAVPKGSAEFAKGVLSEIQHRVAALRNAIKERDVEVARRFPVFSRVFSEGRAPSVTKPTPPKPPKRPFRITGASNRHLAAHPADPTLIRAETTVHLSLTPAQARQNGGTLAVEVTLGWRVLEESGAVQDPALLDATSLRVPAGFSRKSPDSNTFVGVLTDVVQEFTWATTYYPDDWRIAPDPQVVDPAAKQASSGEDDKPIDGEEESR